VVLVLIDEQSEVALGNPIVKWVVLKWLLVGVLGGVGVETSTARLGIGRDLAPVV